MKNKINVLHISPNFNYLCGVSRYVFILLKELKKRDSINLFFITNKGDSLERIRNLNIPIKQMKFESGWKNIIYYRNNLLELKYFCESNKIDIIHSHHRYPELLSNHLKKYLDVKTITTVHSFVDGFRKTSFKSDLIIAVSDAVKRNIVENFGVSEDKIIRKYNPIDKNDFNFNYNRERLRQQYGLSEKDKVFLFVGRNSFVKGIDLILKVFPKIFRINSDVKIFIISNADRKIRLFQSKFLEFVKVIEPQNDISKFYTLSDFVILPSRVESFPFIMLEAGLFNKVFLGSATGGIKEFIINDVDGIIFEPNEFELELIIKKILNTNKKYLENIASNLHKKVIQLDSPQSYCEELIQIYKKLIK